MSVADKEKKELPPIQDVMTRILWGYDDCAVFLKVEPSTIKDKYSKLDTWPARRGGGELGRPMYKAEDVISWAMRRAA